MKKYIVLSGSVDGPTCDGDGFLNCANFDLVGSRECDSLEEAIEVMDQVIEQDKAAFAEFWPEEDGYTLDVGAMNSDNLRYIDVYFKAEVSNEIIYKISGVEC